MPGDALSKEVKDYLDKEFLPEFEILLTLSLTPGIVFPICGAPLLLPESFTLFI